MGEKHLSLRSYLTIVSSEGVNPPAQIFAERMDKQWVMVRALSRYYGVSYMMGCNSQGGNNTGAR